MTAVAVVSAGGSPGVTTTACLVAATWPAGRRVVVAECDPAGGSLAARFGLSPRIGVTSSVIDRRTGAHEGAEASGSDGGGDGPGDRHLQRLPGGLEVLVGPVGADSARALDAELARIPGSVAGAIHGDVIFDCGRFDPRASGQQSLLVHVDAVVVLCTLDPATVARTEWLARRFRSELPDDVARVVVRGGSAPRAREVAAIVHLPLGGVLPEDRRAARALRGEPGGRPLTRSALVVAARRMASELATGGDPGAPGSPEDRGPSDPAGVGDPSPDPGIRGRLRVAAVRRPGWRRPVRAGSPVRASR